MRNFFGFRGKWKGNARLYHHQYGLNSFRSVLVRKYRGKWKGNARSYHHQYGLNSFRSVLVRKYRGKWKGNARSYHHQYGLNSFRSVRVRKLIICDLVFRVSCFLVGDIAKHFDAFDCGLFFVNPANGYAFLFRVKIFFVNPTPLSPNLNGPYAATLLRHLLPLFLFVL